MKKIYQKPTINSEKMEIGVFGCGYGSTDGDIQWNPLFNNFFVVFISLCCSKNLF